MKATDYDYFLTLILTVLKLAYKTDVFFYNAETGWFAVVVRDQFFVDVVEWLALYFNCLQKSWK